MVLILATNFQLYNVEALLQQFDSHIPLNSVKVQGEMTDFVGHVRISQKFENQYSNSIEAIYMFNLDKDSTVIGMKMTIGDRVLVSHIDEKKEARQTYEKAISEKKTTCLLEKASNGIYKVNVGNILPNQTIEIEIEYLTQLSCTDEGEMKFVLPTNISPKYDAPQKTAADRIATASTLSGMTHTSSSLFAFFLDILWRSNNGIKEVKSLTNEITVSAEGEEGKTVRIISETAPSSGDFNLFVTVNEIKPAVYLHEKGSDCYLMINHRMSGLEDLEELEGGDFTILVDRSGSMDSSFEGWSGGRASGGGKTKMDYAREATRLFVQSLPAGSRFNVVSFGSNHQSLFPVSVDYSNENKAKALEAIEKFRADLGGTELYRCLEQVLSSSKDATASKTIKERVVDLSKRVWTPGSNNTTSSTNTTTSIKANDSATSSNTREKIVILMTDGDIGNVDSVVGLIRRHADHARVFTIGIGSDVNRFLVERVAEASHASCEILVDNPNISTVVAKMLDTATRAYFHQTSLSLPPSNSTTSDTATNTGSNTIAVNKPLYVNQFLSIFVKVPTTDLFPSLAVSRASLRLSSKVKSGGEGGSEERQLDWDLSVNREQEGVFGPHHRFIPQLYAADRLRSLENEARDNQSAGRGEAGEAINKEIVRLSLEYQVMNDRTSFVVVDEASAKDPKATSEPVTVTVPQYADGAGGAYRARSAIRCLAAAAPSPPGSAVLPVASASYSVGAVRRSVVPQTKDLARVNRASSSLKSDSDLDMSDEFNDESEGDEEDDCIVEEGGGGNFSTVEKMMYSPPRVPVSPPHRKLEVVEKESKQKKTEAKVEIIEGLLGFQNVDGSFPYSPTTRDMLSKHSWIASSSAAMEERVKTFSTQEGTSEEVTFNVMVLLLLKKDVETAKYVMIIRKLEKWIDKQVSSLSKKSGDLLKALEGLGWFVTP